MPRRYDMGKRAKEIEHTRTRIVSALLRLLARKPYSATTMKDVAREADVSVRTVQRHYSGKDQILGESFAIPARKIAEALARRPVPGSAEQAIRDIVEVRFTRFEAHHAEIWPVYSRS